MLYFIALLPIAFYLLAIKAMDGFALAGWKRMSWYFLWGVASCILGLFFTSYIWRHDDWTIPLLEEILKCLPLVWAMLRRRSAFLVEALIYGTAIGAGFAFVENILYIFYNTDFTVGDAIIRGFGTALLHMGCTALTASLALVISRVTLMNPKIIQYSLTVLCILPPFVIHYVYNLFLLPEFLQLVSVVAIMLIFFMLTYELDCKLIHKWLDLCINNDIALLNAMRAGKLQETEAGKYLIGVKERFRPEVFFDICVFMGLYLEMTIAAKSRMILNEAGVDMPLSDEEKKANADKLTELNALKQNIGVAGLMVLRPIVSIKATDEWVLEEML